MSEHTAPLPQQPSRPRRTGRRGVVVVVAAVLAVVLISGGAFAAWRFYFGAGPRPAEVLPASTFALASVDLDPSGGQKVAAIKTLRTFPSWRKRTGVAADSDLMKSVLDLALSGGPCRALDHEKDLEPWVGSRAAVGGVLLDGDRSVPVLALAIKDRDEARTGFARLARCAGGDDLGWTLTEDYVVASDSKAHARAIVAAGEESQLATDPDFQKWTDEAGGAGIVNLYLAPEAPAALSEVFGSGLGGLPPGLPDDLPTALPSDLPTALPSDLPSALATALPEGRPTARPTRVPTVAPEDSGSVEGAPGPGASVGAPAGAPSDDDRPDEDFRGAAAVLRFADGGIELSVASGAPKSDEDLPTVSDLVHDLPEDTAAVVAVASPRSATAKLDWADDGSGAGLLGGLTGLDLPEDLETLLGESLSLSLGGTAPPDLDSVDGPGDLPLGAVVRGDATKINAVLDKLEEDDTLGDLMTSRSSTEDKVTVATTRAYADQLLAEGTLEDDEGFKQTVRNVEDAQALVYLDLDGDWAERVAEKLSQQDDETTQELAGNLAVLRGLGATAWMDGDTSRALVRLSVK